jgi:hypothetical protein
MAVIVVDSAVQSIHRRAAAFRALQEEVTFEAQAAADS